MNPSSRTAGSASTLLGSILMFWLLILSTSSLSGCIHNTVIKGPDTPDALKTGKLQNTKVRDEIVNFYYNKCLQDAPPTTPLTPPFTLESNCGSRKQQRDTIVYDLKNIIDNNYEAYARHFEQTADTANFAGEVSGASLTAVGTLVGATGLKDILTTASTLTQSTTVSMQKNYFQKQTEYAILSQMDASREKQWNVILQEMGKEEEDYPLSEALNDLQQYKRAGTGIAALTVMTQQSGADAVTNQKKNSDLKTTPKPAAPKPTTPKPTTP